MTMKRRSTSGFGIVVALCLLLAGCSHFGAPAEQRFVNESDSGQVLLLRPHKWVPWQAGSLKAFFVEIHKNHDNEVGQYTLDSGPRRTEGTYKLENGALVIWASGGKTVEWSAKMQNDSSSFRDQKGNLWSKKNVLVRRELHSMAR
jgi:hypothetical protein